MKNFPTRGWPENVLEIFLTEKKIEIFFFSSTQNDPIRKVNMLKWKFDDIFVLPHYEVILARHLDTYFRPKKIEIFFFFHRLKMVSLSLSHCLCLFVFVSLSLSLCLFVCVFVFLYPCFCLIAFVIVIGGPVKLPCLSWFDWLVHGFIQVFKSPLKMAFCPYAQIPTFSEVKYLVCPCLKIPP